MVRSSNATSALGPDDDDGEDDLQALARQTLSDVSQVAVPPEPFAIGFDIASLAASSRPSRPSSEQTDGRIDLAAVGASSLPAPAPAEEAPASRPAPRASGIVPRVVSVTASLAAAPASAAPAVFASAPKSALDRELDDLIAARAFSPAARVTALGTAGAAALLKLPRWVWVLAVGVGIGLAAGGVFSGENEVATASAPAASPSIPTASPQPPPAPVVATGVTWRPYAPGSADSSAPQGATRSGSTRSPSRARSEPARRAESAEAPAPTEGGERSIDELLDRALSPGASPGRPTASVASGASGLPSLPSRDQVARVLSALQPRVRSCAGDRTGVATAQIVARSDGRIVSARIVGAPFSRTSMGRCMESAIRSASFSAFSRPTFRVSYPFQI